MARKFMAKHVHTCISDYTKIHNQIDM